ncbi:DUF3850 domain-containing protein [Variovorax sp. 278MFTsu5.1]|uniref:DUF3850 domain-containing protein n=1 Tax=Variovorax sp. 278MFTsu5.1 TaxID=3158366 RepID=UPI003AACD46A
MKTHILKSWPKFFEPIAAGIRTHELRRCDRDFHVGDRIELREFDPVTNEYTGRVCFVLVMSITSAEEPCAVSEEALNPHFCILSVRLTSQ